MRKILLTLIISILCFTNYAQEIEKNVENITTYYLIRHAEKDISDKTNRNPSLTDKGIERAHNWAEILKNINIDAVYSTNYIRTKNTAKPTALSHKLETIIYDVRNFDFDKFKKETIGKNILIVGHSNTTPMFANALLGKDNYKNLDESVYTNLYIITITGDVASDILLEIE